MADDNYINLGSLAPPLAEQIPDLSTEQGKRFDANRQAINSLRAYGLLTYEEAIRAQLRLLSQIKTTLREGDRDG